MPLAVATVVFLAAVLMTVVVFVLVWQVLGVAPNSELDEVRDFTAAEEAGAFFDSCGSR